MIMEGACSGNGFEACLTGRAGGGIWNTPLRVCSDRWLFFRRDIPTGVIRRNVLPPCVRLRKDQI